MKINTVKMVPLTNEELQFVQTMLVGRMLEINRNIREGFMEPETGDDEIERLSHVSSKISRYSKHTR